MNQRDQMYKVYINESLLLICSSEIKNQIADDSFDVIHHYINKKHLLNHINALESSNEPKKMVIYGDDAKTIFKLFKSLFTIIKAGGGLVFNENDDLLVIFRRGYWDIPKGKKDKGESMRECAIREVQEETSVNNLRIEHKVGNSYHVYRLKNGKRVLKISKWFRMTAPNQKLIPQQEEDIEQSIWLEKSQLEWFLGVTFPSIADIFRSYESKIFNFDRIL